MKLKTFTFLKHKTYLFSFTVLMLGSILSAVPAYSQVDYYYGLNKKGVRFGIGAGVSILQSNWTSNPLCGAALISLDYDFSPYLSLGIQGQFGQAKGEDTGLKLFFKSTSVNYYSSNLNLKVALGQFVDYKTSGALQDAIKRIYIGVGVGSVYSDIVLVEHKPEDGALQSNQYGKTIPGLSGANKGDVGSGAFIVIPVSFGTNISLRGFLGSDKIDLNPSLQYNLVQSPLFDGYQPNADPENPSTKNVNGNQSYFIGSLTLRYKF